MRFKFNVESFQSTIERIHLFLILIVLANSANANNYDDDDDDDDDDNLVEQSGYVTEALRHLHAAQGAAASESRENARQLSVQQQVGNEGEGAGVQ